MSFLSRLARLLGRPVDCWCAHCGAHNRKHPDAVFVRCHACGRPFLDLIMR